MSFSLISGRSLFGLEVGGTIDRPIGVVALLIGGLQVYAGIRCLRMEESGRAVGVVTSWMALIFSVPPMFGGSPVAFVQAAAYGLVALALMRHRRDFPAWKRPWTEHR